MRAIPNPHLKRRALANVEVDVDCSASVALRCCNSRGLLRQRCAARTSYRRTSWARTLVYCDRLSVDPAKRKNLLELVGRIQPAAYAVHSVVNLATRNGCGIRGWWMSDSGAARVNCRGPARVRAGAELVPEGARLHSHARRHARLGAGEREHGASTRGQGLPLSVRVRAQRRPLRSLDEAADVTRSAAVALAGLPDRRSRWPAS